ncbi:hypothetical protein BH24GEM2_BH24GEM2_08000 [soil metagenome]
MPFNVLLLPLLGGYVFVTHWNRTRFSTRRYSGERLIFHSAIAGVVFLVIAFLIVRGIHSAQPVLARQWRSYVPFPYTGTSSLAFFLGCSSWWLANLVFTAEKEAVRAITIWHDYLEVLLNRALTNADLVSITTRSRKVYVGFVLTNFDPKFERKYLTIIPTLSGYRSEHDLQLHFTTSYLKVYQQILNPNPIKVARDADKFQIVIPVAEVVSLNLFDPAAYDLFNAPPAGG